METCLSGACSRARDPRAADKHRRETRGTGAGRVTRLGSSSVYRAIAGAPHRISETQPIACTSPCQSRGVRRRVQQGVSGRSDVCRCGDLSGLFKVFELIIEVNMRAQGLDDAMLLKASKEEGFIEPNAPMAEGIDHSKPRVGVAGCHQGSADRRLLLRETLLNGVECPQEWFQWPRLERGVHELHLTSLEGI